MISLLMVCILGSLFGFIAAAGGYLLKEAAYDRMPDLAGWIGLIIIWAALTLLVSSVLLFFA